MRKRLPAMGIVLGCLGMAAMVMTGCLVTHKASVKVSGEAVLKERLDAVKEGVTTRDDLILAFGQPTQSLKLEDGREVLTYTCERQETVQTIVLFAVQWETSVEKMARYNFELKDGVLIRCWKDDVF